MVTLTAGSGNNNTLTDHAPTASPESPAQNEVQTKRDLTEDERMVELEDQLLRGYHLAASQQSGN